MDVGRLPGTGVGLNLDRTLANDRHGLETLGLEALRLGYETVWVAARAPEPFEIVKSISRRAAESRLGPVNLGIPVMPVTSWMDPLPLAEEVARAAVTTNGRFAFGIGVGHPSVASGQHGAPDLKPIGHASDYLDVLRKLLSGGRADSAGSFIEAQKASISGPVPQVPLYLGALGPAMLRLGGRIADGVVLNWVTREHLAWSRQLVSESAVAAGRDPRSVRILVQARVCVAEDPELAYRVLARELVQMTLRTPIERPDRGYRAHIRRQGFSELFDELASLKEGGTPTDELARRIPTCVVDALAYAGQPEGAAAATLQLAGEADAVIVRVVLPDYDPRQVIEAMTACLPAPSLQADS